MKAVFLDQKTLSEQIQFDALEQVVEQIIYYPTTAAELVVKRCENSDIILTNKVVLTAQILAQLPKLKLICITATGTNNVDLTACQQLGIAVTNVSGYSKQSVSQYVFAMLLNHLNKTQHYIDYNRQQRWPESSTFCFIDKPITELAGKTLGIVGYGSLGKKVAQIAQAFDMKVLIAERENASELRDNRVAFEQVLQQSDFLSLHCPLTEQTDKLINKQSLALMKKGAVLINTARGQLIDNQAMLDAIDNQQLSAAIIDVLDVEPPPKGHLLIQQVRENIYLTAHLAWGSLESQQTLIDLVAKNITAFKAGGQLNRIV